MLAGEKIYGDDTPVRVLGGKGSTARLWVYVRDERPIGAATPSAMWFRYSGDCKGEHPQQHLKNYRGILQADAYAGYMELYKTPDQPR